MKNEKNNKKELLEYVKENWKNIPYLREFSEEEIQRFVESGYTNKNGNSNEYATIQKMGIKELGDKEYERISSYVLELNEYGEEEYFLTSIMEFGNDGKFRGHIYGDTEIEFKMNEKGEPEFLRGKNNKEELLKYVKENWKNIPYLCRFSEEEIQRFVESGYTNKN